MYVGAILVKEGDRSTLALDRPLQIDWQTPQLMDSVRLALD